MGARDSCDHDLDHFACAEWGMYGYVKWLGHSLLHGAATSALGETYVRVCGGVTYSQFDTSTYDVLPLIFTLCSCTVSSPACA